MTKRGIPVFNTPGSNANAVKELVLCALFLASRGIIDGSLHMKKLHAEGTASARIEKDKALFGGALCALRLAPCLHLCARLACVRTLLPACVRCCHCCLHLWLLMTMMLTVAMMIMMMLIVTLIRIRIRMPMVMVR
jgi:hypothetical protein